MVDEISDLTAVFHALAHDSRREMVERLAASDLTVGQLAEPLAMSLAAASKHVQVLERAGLVRLTVDGRRHVCRLVPGPLVCARGWLGSHEPFETARPAVRERRVQDTPFSEEVD